MGRGVVPAATAATDDDDGGGGGGGGDDDERRLCACHLPQPLLRKATFIRVAVAQDDRVEEGSSVLVALPEKDPPLLRRRPLSQTTRCPRRCSL